MLNDIESTTRHSDHPTSAITQTHTGICTTSLLDTARDT